MKSLLLLRNTAITPMQFLLMS